MPKWQDIALKSALHKQLSLSYSLPKQGKTRLNEEYVGL